MSREPRIYDNAMHLMEVQGGSFVKAIAHAYLVADPTNRKRLRDAFSDYFATYEAHFAALPADRRAA